MLKLYEKDAHVHTPYCPHRYNDEPIENYLRAAEERGLKEITFTEHMPTVAVLPTPEPITFNNPDLEGIMEYFAGLKEFREKYQGPVKINIGMEVDYLEGYEDKTTEMLNKLGPYLEESILSIHFILINGKYYYVANKNFAARAVEDVGSAEKVNEIYYQTLLKAMQADLGPYKPKKLGHCTIIRIVHKQFPGLANNPALLEEVARQIKEGGYTIDLNMQGLRNEFCQEIFGIPLLPYIKKYDIPVTLGSDSHWPQDVAVGFDHADIMDNLSWLRPEWVESEGLEK